LLSCRPPVSSEKSREEDAMQSIGLDVGNPVAEVAISEPGRVAGSRDARDRMRRERDMERAVLAQAEAGFVAFVEALVRRTRSPPNGERLG
jgi:hypothetical protein